MTTAWLSRATPFFFGSGDGRLFGWTHPPRSDSRRRPCGVVLCNPVGGDLMRAHRPMRHLAERLADAGFWVLRFDYHGTGDSPADERAPGRVSTWLEDVSLAIDELSTRAGLETISLVGLRLGALLATAAASRRGGVDSLVLWGPYESGQAFVAESTRVHKMHTLLEPASFSGGAPQRGGEEALGFFLTDETIADLQRLDTSSVRDRPARGALVIGTSNTPGEGRLMERLRHLQVPTSYRHMPGSKFLITTPHLASVPEEVLSHIVEWLSDRYPPVAGSTSPERPAREPSISASSSARREQPVFLGRERPLFGIHHRPRAAGPGPSAAVLMLNAGCVNRTGAHRLYVPLARRWAGLGFHVLRFDLSGIGDSPAAPGCSENLTYPRDGLDDVERAMDHLQKTEGIDRFVVIGLCSGADIAFQIGLQSQRVSGVVMLNPRTFCVHDLGMVDGYQRIRWYKDSLSRGSSWKKLLRGEVDLLRAAHLVLPKIKEAALRKLERALDRRERDLGKAKSMLERDVPESLRGMVGRGVDTFLLVTEHDPGVDYVDGHDGRSMKALASLPGFRRVDLNGTDHTFTALWAQHRVGELVTTHLCHRFLRSEPARSFA